MPTERTLPHPEQQAALPLRQRRLQNLKHWLALQAAKRAQVQVEVGAVEQPQAQGKSREDTGAEQQEHRRPFEGTRRIGNKQIDRFTILRGSCCSRCGWSGSSVEFIVYLVIPGDQVGGVDWRTQQRGGESPQV